MTGTARRTLGRNGASTTVHVPLTFRRRGGRKQVVTPNGAPAWTPCPLSIDSTLVKAIARAFRWQRILDGGAFASVAELAAAEKINSSYMARVLRLTLLAPEIVEGIINGQQEPVQTLDRLLQPFPIEWSAQNACFRA
jgi:hypothetical protein